jgi:hypothetical protein
MAQRAELRHSRAERLITPATAWGHEAVARPLSIVQRRGGWHQNQQRAPEGADELSVVRSVPDPWSHRFRMPTCGGWTTAQHQCPTAEQRRQSRPPSTACK